MEIYQIHLRPADFFTRNPALDVPSTKNQASVLVPCCGGDAAATNGAEQKGISASEQQNPLAHLQGTGPDIKAETAGASEADDGKAESKLSKAFTDLFKRDK